MRKWVVLLLVLTPVFTGAWKPSVDDRREAPRRAGVHYHSKRHMLPAQTQPKRRTTTPRARDIRKKPSGHLTPLEEDDMDNDEIVSVAIGPPPIRPKFDKVLWKQPQKPITNGVNSTATTLVKEVLTQLGREFLTNQVSEDFVFGQFIGNAMRNLTSDLRLKMQHEILDLVVKFQKLNRGELPKVEEELRPTLPTLKDVRTDKKFSTNANETDENWPDFTNLAKIVG